MRKQLPAWLALAIISLAAGLLLALTNALTADRIEEQAQVAANEARFKAIATAESFEEMQLPESTPLDNCFAAIAGGETVGYVAQISVKGYGGPIEVVTGVDIDGVVTGVVVGGSGFAETAGLGAKTKDAAFTGQFTGKQPPLLLKQDIDSVSGASISSGAVVSGVNKSYDYVRTLLPGYVPEDSGDSGAVETRVVTVKGFAGDIDVSVGLAADGTIASLDIGGDSFAETAGLGERVTEKAFRDQFIGRSGALSYGDGIDAITGATITSDAVMGAVNEALAAGPVVGPALFTETVKGFAGDIDVTVGLKADGTIASLDIGGDSFAETAGLGERVTEKAFRDQFIGRSGALSYGDGIDAIAGATITSDAVMGAINQILTTAEPSAEASAPVAEAAPTEAPVAEVEPTEAPVVEAVPTEAPVAEAPVDGQTVTVKGFAGDIDVTVGLAADGTIASLDIGGDSFAETAGLGERVKEEAFRDQFIGRSGALSCGDGIDAIAGATITSDAVMGAINQILAGGDAPAIEADIKQTVTVKGFAGDIDVTVGVNASGEITSLDIGGDSFAETAGLGERVKEEAFRDQFIGRSGALSYGEGIDAIAGATITSDAVMSAINQVLAG